jgi:23S rRNA pseudouridine1911/1915/1917 synthase
VIDESVPDALDGERVDRVVALLADVSRADAVRLVDAGAIVVDDAVVAAGKQRVRVGQRILIDVAALPGPALPTADAGVEVTVVYADDDVIVVDKEPGVVVHPGAGNPDGTLVNGLLARFPELADVGEAHRPGIVHRLDVGTSGLLVVARSATAYERLVDDLSAHRVERGYRALVWGWPEQPVGIVDAPIGRDPRDPLRMAVTADGRPARTRYEVLARFREPAAVTLVACRLETGRTHQIRVHLAALGHPVVGDAAYGGSRSALTPARPMLHAAELAFDHPVTGEHLTFTSALPADLERILSVCA